MFILHIAETGLGGIGTYLNLIANDEFKGQKSAVLIPSFHAKAIDDDIEMISYPANKRGLQNLYHLAKASFKAIKDNKPDIVFLHCTFSLLVLLLLRLTGYKKPIIYCPHGWAGVMYEPGSLKSHIIKWIEGWVPKLADSVICISKFDLEYAKENGYKFRPTLIENAVKPSSCLPNLDVGDLDRDIQLTFVGRFDRQKGFDFLLQAFNDVCESRQDLHLTTAGATVRANLPIHVESSTKVDHLGWVDQTKLDQILSETDLLLVPSRWEGFGLVVPEAFRNGTPVLVSDQGALPGLVEEEKTGFVIPLDAESWVDFFEEMDLKTLRGMRKDCLKEYEVRFKIDRFYKEIITIYRSLLSKD